MELEQIVKKFVPLGGIFETAGFDDRKITIPSQLLETLKRRQRVEEISGIELFYRVHQDEVPPYIELTDYLPDVRNVNFSRYKLIPKILDANRISMTDAAKKKIGIVEGDALTFLGKGNGILIYRTQDYDRYIKSGFNPRGILNLVVRMVERFTYP